MKKFGITLVLFFAVTLSLWAKPGALPYIFRIENLLTKESITYYAKDLTSTYNNGRQEFSTPIISFTKGIYASDPIKITMSNPDHWFLVWSWAVSYNSQSENLLGENEYNSYTETASITHSVSQNLPQDNMNMEIRAYTAIPVSTKGAYNAPYSYHFKFSGVHNYKRYTIKDGDNDVIIVIGPPMRPSTPLAKSNATSTAKLYDSFGNLKKTVLLTNNQNHIYVGDLNHGIYLVKLTIDGIEFTEKINL